MESLRKHRGKWIAILDSYIIAHGTELRDLYHDLWGDGEGNGSNNNGGGYSSVLYVGANKNRQHFLDLFAASGYERIVVLEAFEENYLHLRERFERQQGGAPYRVVHGRAQDVSTLGLGSFDVVFFWHGPEHLPHPEVAPTLGALERVAKKVVVCGMPFGLYEQGAEYGNPFEVHRSHLTPEFIESLGYVVDTLGARDREGSNLTAWKYL